MASSSQPLSLVAARDGGRTQLNSGPYENDVQGAMKLGARAYLLKNQLDRELLGTIRTVYSGN
jgi:DNA-binding NarL/FixJ family response regulator